MLDYLQNPYFLAEVEKIAGVPFLDQDRPESVKKIYRALKRDHPDMPAEQKARIAARQGKPGKQKQGPPYKGPIQDKVAFSSPVQSLIGQAPGAVLGYQIGREGARQTAAAVAPTGRKTRAEAIANKAAIPATVLGSLAAMYAMRGRGGSARKFLASRFPKLSPGEVDEVIRLAVPTLSGVAGGTAAGVGTGAVVGGAARLRGPKSRQKTAARRRDQAALTGGGIAAGAGVGTGLGDAIGSVQAKEVGRALDSSLRKRLRWIEGSRGTAPTYNPPTWSGPDWLSNDAAAQSQIQTFKRRAGRVREAANQIRGRARARGALLGALIATLPSAVGAHMLMRKSAASKRKDKIKRLAAGGLIGAGVGAAIPASRIPGVVASERARLMAFGAEGQKLRDRLKETRDRIKAPKTRSDKHLSYTAKAIKNIRSGKMLRGAAAGAGVGTATAATLNALLKRRKKNGPSKERSRKPSADRAVQSTNGRLRQRHQGHSPSVPARDVLRPAKGPGVLPPGARPGPLRDRREGDGADRFRSGADKYRFRGEKARDHRFSRPDGVR